jgi:CheY-like chemotaxis protein
MSSPEIPTLHVLVVDDDPAVGRLIQLLLEQDGHAAQTVCNGEAALALVDQCPFDLLITDYRMPGVKGDEIAARIKNLHPSLRIIMATGFLEKSAVCATESGNVDALILKPFSHALLRRVICLVMSKGSNEGSFIINPLLSDEFSIRSSNGD